MDGLLHGYYGIVIKMKTCIAAVSVLHYFVYYGRWWSTNAV